MAACSSVLTRRFTLLNISGVLILQEQDHEITPLHGQIHSSLYSSSRAESLGVASQERHGNPIQGFRQDCPAMDRG
jgi:hypothetical protein